MKRRDLFKATAALLAPAPAMPATATFAGITLRCGTVRFDRIPQVSGSTFVEWDEKSQRYVWRITSPFTGGDQSAIGTRGAT